MSIQDEFRARLQRDVTRFIRHAILYGMDDVWMLSGKTVLTIDDDGKLVDVRFPGEDEQVDDGGITEAVETFRSIHADHPTKRKKRQVTEDDGE